MRFETDNMNILASIVNFVVSFDKDVNVFLQNFNDELSRLYPNYGFGSSSYHCFFLCRGIEWYMTF